MAPPVGGAVSTLAWVAVVYVNEGEALFHVARFSRPDKVARGVEEIQQELDPSSDIIRPARRTGKSAGGRR